MAEEHGSTIFKVQSLVVSAVALAREKKAKEAVFVFLRALDLADSESIVEVIWQFGAMLSVVLAACSEMLHLLEPQQRRVLAQLAQSISASGRAATSMPAASEIAITPREIDVIRALGDGQSSKEIARTLGVAESTVKTHRINIYRKLNVATRSQAIAKARTTGLI